MDDVVDLDADKDNDRVEENADEENTMSNQDETGDNTGIATEDVIETNKRSFVWDHFKFVKGATSAKCPYCSAILQCDSAHNGTSGLGKHLKHACATSPVYVGKRMKKESKIVDTKKQSVIGFKPGAKGISEMAAHSFNQEKCRKSLAKMCIKDNRPFSIVDDEGYREHAWELNPLFKIPSRWTVARDCLAIYKEEATNLKKLLKGQTLSLTTDTWSSVQNINYMCLTGHWIDDNWVLRKKILNFCPIANHKGTTIGQMVHHCLKKWNIDRVFTVTVDNAASNDGAIRFLKNVLKGRDAILDCKYMHLRCCAHIVNLVVRDGLDEQHESIARIRRAVRFVRSSPAREATFKECVDWCKIDCHKKVSLDVDTRWNSTYLMLETAVKYAEAFERLQDIDTNYRAYFDSEVDHDDVEVTTRKRKRKDRDRVVGPPEESDWVKAKHFIQFLRIFYNVTNLISGSKYVTSNFFFNELVAMNASITKMCESFELDERDMAICMKAKFDKYWDNLDNINLLLYVSVVFDPRNKMRYLTFCLQQTYGVGSQKGKEISTRVLGVLNELFDHYKMKADKNNWKRSSSSTSTLSTDTSCGGDMKVDLESNFLKYLEEEEYVMNKSELEIYLSDGMEKRDENFDILSWWKINSLKFPILSQVARHVLGMPISTVASESAFSIGGRVIDPFRSSLTPKTAEALICAQDWIRSSPADIEHNDVNSKDLEELQEKLDKIELESFASGSKFFSMQD